MLRIQALRLFSIVSALVVGFWLPLKMIGLHFHPAIDLSLDLLISCAAAVSLSLRFFGTTRLDVRDWRNWIHPGALADLVCLMPLMLIQDALFSGADIGLVFLNLLIVRHIWKIKSFLDEFDNLKPIVYRLVPLGLMMPLMVHLIACGWIALGSGNIGPDSDKVFEYVKAVYWAMTTLTTVGYGDIAAKSAAQMLYAAATQLVGVGVFGFILSNVASLLSRLDAAREHHMDNLDQIEGFMASYSIPVDVKSKVRGYYHYVWKEHKGRLDKSLLEQLPNKLKSELNSCINKAVIERVSFLQTATPELLEDMMLALDHRVYVPGERIFRAGEHGDCLYMIHSGEVDILNPKGDHVARLGAGSVFGEIALVSEAPRNATAQSKTYCDLYALPKSDFYRIVDAYPQFKSHLDEIIAERRTANSNRPA
jgi:Cyclic nucleotide-binding domain/Ion channel